jgi:Mg-chelatase subunit ChlD
VEEAMSDDPDDTMAMLADLTGATDPALRELARRLAGRLFLDVARRGPMRPRGVGRLREQPFRPDGGDLDLDASLDALQLASATGTAPRADELTVRTWARPAVAICLVIDRSGSMSGDRLAASAIAAAAVAERAPDDFSVLAFSDKVMVIKGQDQRRSIDDVVEDVFRLRGHGPTDLGLALRVAADQLASSTAQRKRVVLLSDCRPTKGTEPERDAGALDELHVIAPAEDSGDAEAFARAVGARFVALSGPSQIPSAFAQLAD